MSALKEKGRQRKTPLTCMTKNKFLFVKQFSNANTEQQQINVSHPTNRAWIRPRTKLIGATLL